jgi:hypothetical protein
MINSKQTPAAVDTKALLMALGQLSLDLEAVRVAVMALAAEQADNLPLLARLAPLEEALRLAERSVLFHSIPAMCALAEPGDGPS